MSQPSPASAGRAARARMALRNWRVSWRLIALIVVPAAMGLTFAGLQVSTAVRNAQTMGGGPAGRAWPADHRAGAGDGG
jgi:hypothetical protein